MSMGKITCLIVCVYRFLQNKSELGKMNTIIVFAGLFFVKT